MLPIAATKLYAPPLNPAMIPRPRLLQQLTDGRNAGRGLTLVVAPAGYGKSTLLTTWLHGAGCPTGWVSLDEGDNDPVRFAACLTTALARSLGDEPFQTTASVLRLPQAVSPEALAAHLINDMAALTVPFLLALDDYHRITEQAVHQIVQTLIDRRPPALHLVIASRSDPPLSVSRWRARGGLTEVRAAELRFTGEESAEFFRHTLRLDLHRADVTALEARTEGWAAGMYLAGLSLQGRTPEAARTFVEQFSGSDRFVIDYLADEVLRQQPPEVCSFLCQTAILERLSAPLCDAVTVGSNSRAMLTALERANLFLVPLDDHREWYRYHHLFREVLRTELTEPDRLELHLRAARWLEEAGQRSEALRQYAMAREFGEAARLVRESADELLDAGDARTLLAWLALLPDDAINRDPELVVYRLWAFFISGQTDAAAACMRQSAEVLESIESPRLRGRVRCFQAMQASFAGDPRAIGLAEEGLHLVPPDDHTGRCAMLIACGVTSLMRPDTVASARHLRDAYELARRHDQPLLAMIALMDLAIVLNALGRRREAADLCEEGIGAYSDRTGRPLPAAGMALIQQAALLCDANRLDEARTLAAMGLELSRQIGFYLHVAGDALGVSVAARLAEGDIDGAIAEAREVAEAARKGGIQPVMREATRLEMEALIRKGELEPVARWVEEMTRTPPRLPSLDRSALTAARYYLAVGQVGEASALLDRVEREARHEGLVRQLIECLVLRAAMQKAPGLLEEAARLAEPEGYARLLLVDGAATHRPLPVRQTGGVVPVGIGEHLTEREVELLRLVAAGLSNGEIAARLFISLTTTKWHIRNIFDKLGVHSRTQAAARARELNLL